MKTTKNIEKMDEAEVLTTANLLDKSKASAAISDLSREAKEAFFDDDFIKALGFLTDAIEAGPDSAQLFSDRAQVCIKLESYHDAITDCNKAVELDPLFWKAYYRKGVAYMKLKNYISAREALQTALDICSGESRITSLLNECRELDGKYSQTAVAGKANLVSTSTAILNNSPQNDNNPQSVTGEKSRTVVRKRSERKKTTMSLQIDLPHYDENQDTLSDGKSKVFLIYDNKMTDHRPLANDMENAKRIPSIIAELEARGLIRRCEVSEVATPLAREHALAVHSNEYLKFIETLPFKGKCPKRYEKYIQNLSEFVYSRGTPTAIFLAAGAVVEACKRVVMGDFLFAFAIVRPPGHHASAAKASGFCYLNNIAIAARYLQREHKMKKVLIVDFDVHHGDGTQSIFSEDSSVMFFSVHRNDIFPDTPSEIPKEENFVGNGVGKGFNVNVNLTAKLKDSDMIAVFDFLLLPLAEQFCPDFVLVSAGFDAAVGDPLGRSNVTPGCFGQIVGRLKNILHGNLVLALEGGYNHNSLAESCAASVEALLGEDVTADERSMYKDLHASTWEVITKLRARLREFWTIFSDDIVNPPEDLHSDTASSE